MKTLQKVTAFIGFLAVLLTFTGCAAPKFNYSPSERRVAFPEIGTNAEAQIGDSMLRKGVISEFDAIKVNTTIKVWGSYTITPGYFKKAGEERDSEYFLPFQGDDSGSIIKGALSDPWIAIEASKDRKKVGIVTVFNVRVFTDAKDIESTKRTSTDGNSFEQRLIYNGKSGSKIRVGYREFSNNYARSAFSNEVEYDLSESMVIGYKGARLEIIEANNTFVRFRVLASFNDTK